MNFGTGVIKLNNIKTYQNIDKNRNTIFKDKFYSDVEDIDYNNYEDINYNSIDLVAGIEESKNKKEWYETVGAYVSTAVTSFYWGVLDVVEAVTDGAVMLGSAVVSAQCENFDKIFGTDTSSQVKQWAQDYIAYDWTDAGYSATVDALGIDEEIAYGTVHSISSIAGSMAGYTALSLIPGGAVVTATTGALSAAGSSAQQAFNCGATYEEALTVSVVAAGVGGLSGAGLNKIGGLASNSKSLSQVFGYALGGGVIATTEPIINSTAEYLTYGKNMVDENGNQLYNNFLDYYVGSGGLLNTGIAFGIGGITTGIKGVKGYRLYNKNINEFRRNKIFEELKNNGVSDEESKKISKAIANHYKNARKNSNGKFNSTFVSYRDHGELHVIEVANYSKEMALRNVKLDENAARHVYFAGLLHDTGMEDAMSVVSKIGEKLDVNLADKSINGIQVRTNHSLNSALIVLSDESLLPNDIDKDVIAMLSLSHSKKSSGINSFKTKQQWLDSIELLEKSANQNGISFDANKMRNMVNNDSTFAILQEQATCLRAGDSFSKIVVDENGNQIMQTADSAIVKNNNPRTNFNDTIKPNLEIEMMDISDITTGGIEVTDAYGKAYHIGESNVSFTDNYTGQNFFDLDVTFKDANNVPNASKMVIEERIGELKTFDHIEKRNVNIHLPKSSENKNALSEFYINHLTGAGGTDVKVNFIFDK